MKPATRIVLGLLLASVILALLFFITIYCYAGNGENDSSICKGLDMVLVLEKLGLSPLFALLPESVRLDGGTSLGLMVAFSLLVSYQLLKPPALKERLR